MFVFLVCWVYNDKDILASCCVCGCVWCVLWLCLVCYGCICGIVGYPVLCVCVFGVLGV